MLNNLKAGANSVCLQKGYSSGMTQSSAVSSPYLSGSLVVSPVGLVLTEWRNRRNAMTVSFFSEVAHYPTTLWVSIAQSSFTHDLIEASGRFTLVVLDDSQQDIARSCGFTSGRATDKCERLNLCYGPKGELYMKDVFASAACTVREAYSLGEQTLYIADILAGEFETRRSIRRHLLTTDLG
jgi:flavin reductase (DIM6/NTAB) family NADH-FMN oxidoreductase RutF